MALPVTKRRVPTALTPSKQLKILEAISSGCTLRDACREAKLGPNGARTLYRQCSRDSKLAAAVREARRVGAGSNADTLLELATELYQRGRAGKLREGEVASFKEFANNVRWLLARHAPAEFGGESVGPNVQIVINSSLPLDGEAPAGDASREAGYTLQAVVSPRGGGNA